MNDKIPEIEFTNRAENELLGELFDVLNEYGDADCGDYSENRYRDLTVGRLIRELIESSPDEFLFVKYDADRKRPNECMFTVCHPHRVGDFMTLLEGLLRARITQIKNKGE